MILLYGGQASSSNTSSGHNRPLPLRLTSLPSVCISKSQLSGKLIYTTSYRYIDISRKDYRNIKLNQYLPYWSQLLIFKRPVMIKSSLNIINTLQRSYLKPRCGMSKQLFIKCVINILNRVELCTISIPNEDIITHK